MSLILKDPFYWASNHVQCDMENTSIVFTTRYGGVSQGDYAGINYGRGTKDSKDNVKINYQQLAKTIEIKNISKSKQVHGSEICVVESLPSPFENQLYDGQLTKLTDVALCIQVADCLPIALAGKR